MLDEKSILKSEFLAIHQQADWISADDDKDELASYYRSVHALKEPDQAGQTALCLSGGGIRSAAFGLGVLQGLARHGLLSQLHYLSTVSGGGYIGGWLTAWTNRAASAPQPASFGDIERRLGEARDPGPLGELRCKQTFLTPRTGIVSPDSWAAFAHIVRNLLLNWLVFVPFLAALLLLPHLVEAGLFWWTTTTPHNINSSLLQLMNAVWPWGPESKIRDLEWRSFLDSVAALFVAIGLVFSMANRAADCSSAIGDKGFRLGVLTPVTIGAFLLLMASCAWLVHREPTSIMCSQWIVLCGVTFPLIRTVAWVYILRRGVRTDPEQQTRKFLLELAAQAVSGAFIGLLIWAGMRLRYTLHDNNPRYLRDVAMFGLPWFLASFLLGQILLSGLTSHLLRMTGDRNREWLARASGWYGAVAVGWLALSWVTLYGWQTFQEIPSLLVGLTLGSGILSLFGGASSVTKVAAAVVSERLRASTIISALSVVFILSLSVCIAHETAILLHAAASWYGVSPGLSLETGSMSLMSPDSDLPAEAMQRFWWICGAIFALSVLSVVASYFVNVNYFSLNALYRNRLVRAFLGASNIEPVTERKPERNPFDGFAEADNLHMADLWQATALPARRSPFLVVNMALNLTAVENTAWQERKAASFISTPLHTGGHLVGYRPSNQYAGGGGLTLGTAMSISGAAVSPNWGYHSSPVTSFLMALFNVRLGCWLGNPRRDETWTLDGPRFGLRLFWDEALGHTSADDKYVYLSDGGHFENLGLYEMVRRRCRTIVVVDAGADPDCALEDLGNAVRKIRIDFGIFIDFDRIDMSKRGKDPANPGVYCAVGRIIYPEEGASQGTIIYIKPGLYADAPADVRAYGAANAKFPHDTTLNQWFTESQFESYRSLGSHAIRMITSDRDVNGNIRSERSKIGMGEFIRCATGYVRDNAARTGAPAKIRLAS